MAKFNTQNIIFSPGGRGPPWVRDFERHFAILELFGAPKMAGGPPGGGGVGGGVGGVWGVKNVGFWLKKVPILQWILAF